MTKVSVDGILFVFEQQMKNNKRCLMGLSNNAKDVTIFFPIKVWLESEGDKKYSKRKCHLKLCGCTTLIFSTSWKSQTLVLYAEIIRIRSNTSNVTPKMNDIIQVEKSCFLFVKTKQQTFLWLHDESTHGWRQKVFSVFLRALLFWFFKQWKDHAQ